MERRNTQVERAHVTEASVREVWVRAGGRCILCSKYLLGAGRTYFHHIPDGQVAHNVGATEGKKSPRGKSELSIKERALPENLLLLCHQCHRMVDAPGAEKIYTEDYLSQHKRAHEDHVRRATKFATVTSAAVVRVTGRVRGTLAPVTDRQVAAALFSEDLRTAGEHQHDSELVVSIDSNDTDAWVWDEGTGKISTKLMALRDSPYDTIAVFALAPIPLLVYLGSELDDKTDIRVFPRFRDAEDLAWCWRNTPVAPPEFNIAATSADPSAHDVVLALSVSATVPANLAPAECADYPLVAVTADRVGPDAIQTKADLVAFSAAWRAALARVESDFPVCERIHLLAAVPTVAAIASGQHHMRDSQPTLVVYQRTSDSYVEALRVGRR